YSLEKENNEHKAIAKIAVSVSKRNFKKAVDRNRLKRLIREAWRLQKNDWKNALQKTNLSAKVFIIYTAKEKMSFIEVKDKIAKVLDKLNKQTGEKLSSIT